METQLRWHKKWYESQYQLFLEDQQIGEISPVAFSSKTIACLNGEKYLFRPRGFMLRKIEISDAATLNQLGEICFIGFGINGIIILKSKEAFQLRCKNIFTDLWTISRSREDLITYTGNHMRGKIQSDLSNQMVLLAGLYASIFQWRKIVLLIIVLLPVIVVLIRTI